MTHSEAMRLYTRLFTEWLGEKPPSGFGFNEKHGCWVRYNLGKAPGDFTHISVDVWPCERVDWNAIHLLIEKSVMAKGWNIGLQSPAEGDSDWAIDIGTLDSDTQLGMAWGSQPADMLAAFKQAAGIA
jgi:hypothetical protein